MEALGGRDFSRSEETLARMTLVGEGEAFNQFALEDIAAKRVGARFQHSPEAAAGKSRAKGAQRFANGGGVVGEVVDDGDAVNLRANFETPAHAAEAGKGFCDCFGGNSLPGSERRGCCRVEGVVFAGHGQRELGPGLAGTQDAPVAGAVFEVQIGEAPRGVFAESVTINVTESMAQALGDVL
jgi:hypothetical protein